MLKSQKHVFWEALLVTILIFTIGIFFGILIEGNRMDTINEYYAQSEISLMDMIIYQDIVKSDDTTCETLIESNIKFADKIYSEAVFLSRYDDQQLTKGAELAQKRYSLLRTLLWMDIIKTQENCENDFNSVIYLYRQNTQDLTKKAEQKVWSKILGDLKEELGNEIILIPIGVVEEDISLNTIIKKYEITELPAVIVNDHPITEISSKEDLKKYLNE
jgi:hypothetical protein